MIDYQAALRFAELNAGSGTRLGLLADAFLVLYAEDVAPKNQLTPRQLDVLRFIASYFEARNYAPSFKEIAAQFSLHSLASVHEHLQNLERKGWIERDFNTARSITIRRHPPAEHFVRECSP